MLLSEFYYRRLDNFKLMQESVNILDVFKANGNAVEGIIYTNSRVLPANDPTQLLSRRTTIFDG
jgi:hypothetical protein